MFGFRSPRIDASDWEIHIPISPTRTFFNYIHYLAASLRLNGGTLANSRIVVTIGHNGPAEDLYRLLPWSRRYPIEWKWLDPSFFDQWSFYGTALERFRHPFRSPYVLMLDADILITASLDRLLEKVRREQSLFGLIAHISPFQSVNDYPPTEWWQRIFAQAGLGTPPLVCEHRTWGIVHSMDTARFCPPYFNLGVLAAPANVMTAIGNTIYNEMEHVNQVLETFFRCQIALTLALIRQQLPWQPLRMRYNLGIGPRVTARFPREVSKVRLFHYFGSSAEFSKAREFASLEAIDTFLKRSNLPFIINRFQQQLARVHPIVKREQAVSA
jgi:hypothetical protein